jgi:ankyrin repeat protein
MLAARLQQFRAAGPRVETTPQHVDPGALRHQFHMRNVLVSEGEEKRDAELQFLALGFARAGQTKHLRAMITAGLPVNLCDEEGNSLLMLARYNGHFHTARMLLDHGAEVDRRTDGNR